MNSPESQRLHKLISSSGQSELFNDLVPKIVDTTLHHLLWTFEQNELNEINVANGDSKNKSIKEISDGLVGELYTEDGWISLFSDKNKS